MTSQGNEKSTFGQITEDILTVTSDMRNLFDKLNQKPKKDWWLNLTDTSVEESDVVLLTTICNKIEQLKDKNTLEVFKNCFDENTIAGKKLQNYIVQNGEDPIAEKIGSFLNGEFEKQIDANQRNISNAIGGFTTGDSAVSRAAKKILKKPATTSMNEEDYAAVQRSAEDPIDRFVIHVNNNLQSLAKLDVEISKLLALKDNKELRDFRDDVREKFISFKEKLLDPAGFLMQNGQTEVDRVNNFKAFIGSTDYQSMAYVIADIKFRFTNQIMDKISRYEKTLMENHALFGLDISADRKNSLSAQIYQKIRDNSGISKLESNNLDNISQSPNDPLFSAVQKISDINAYMDGMISVKALLDARHKNSLLGQVLGIELRPNLDRKKVSNAILLGLDPDLGFTDEIKQKYGENYNAYISGCVEECLITSSPELFSRIQDTDMKGILEINKKDKTKRGNIQEALGIPKLTGEQERDMLKTGFRDELGFADITKFNLELLENQFERSKAKANRTLGTMNYTEPLWRILAAIKPMKSMEDPSSKEYIEAPLYQKITNYQRILDTMKIYLLPYRGRARINLDLDNAADLKQQGRGVIDRMIHLMNLHQQELSELPTKKLKEIQTENSKLFKNFDTDIFVRTLKKMGKGVGRTLYEITHGPSTHNPESEHKRRKMQYLKLESEISEQVSANEKLVDDSKPNPKSAHQYVEEKLRKKFGSNRDSLARYVQLKDEDLERLIKKWLKDQPNDIDEDKYIEEKIAQHVRVTFKDKENEEQPKELIEMMDKIYSKMKSGGAKFEEKTEKYNAPTLLLQALSEEINKERTKIDPLESVMNIYRNIPSVEGRTFKEKTRAEERRELLVKTEFFAVDTSKLSNDELIARTEMCIEKIQNGALSSVDRPKYYEEMLKCNQLLDRKQLTSVQENRRQSLRYNLKSVSDLSTDDISDNKNNNSSNRIVKGTSIYNTESLTGGGGPNSDIVTNDTEFSSNRESSLKSTNFFKEINKSHSEDQQAYPSIKIFINTEIEPLLCNRDRIFDLPEDERTDDKFDPIESAIKEKLNEWNRINPDQIIQVDENFNLILPNSNTLKK
jgi:hypothetical protein